MAIFGQKSGFLVMAARKHMVICSKDPSKTFLRIEKPDNGVWGPTTDHSGPKNGVLGENMGFFGDL